MTKLSREGGRLHCRDSYEEVLGERKHRKTEEQEREIVVHFEPKIIKYCMIRYVKQGTSIYAREES